MIRRFSRHRRWVAITLAVIVYLQPIILALAPAHGAYRAYGAYRAPSANGASASATPGSIAASGSAPVAPFAPLVTKAPYAPFAPYARYAPSVAAAAEMQAAEPVVVFGPNQYVRTTGSPNIYNASFAKPAWLTGPFTMRVENGSPSGTNRLSSTTILLNDVEVAVPTDFSQLVAGFDKTVTLLAQNVLELRVTSIPLGYLTLSFSATNGDHTAPQLVVTSPPNGAFMNTEAATITVQASDPAGAGEPAASGINISTLHILVDGVDRTASFTTANGVATAQIDGLTQGTHAITATVSDVAGNAGSAASSFTIDRAVPQLSVTAPANGAFLNDLSTAVTVQVADASGPGSSGINPATLSVLIDDADRTAEFTLANGTATAPMAGLAEGIHTITASIADVAGNTGTTGSGFAIDRTAPQLAVTSPPNGVFMNTETATITVQASDTAGPVPSGIDISTLRILVDGVDRTAAFAMANGVATAQLGGLAAGTHAISATISDVAGNASTASSGFTIDLTVPQVSVTVPGNGAFLNGLSTTITVQVADAAGSGLSGIAPATLAVLIDNADRTAEFTLANGTATAQIAGLAEGAHTVSASIGDVAGNTGTTSSSFTIDRTAPLLAVTAPMNGAFMNTETATVTVQVGDPPGAGEAAPSGINLSTLQILVDGVDSTASFAIANGIATAQFVVAAGTHTISATISDVADNAGSVASSFTIDRTVPQVAVTAPANGAFVNGEPTTITVQVADAAGSGIDSATLQVVIDGAARTADFTLVGGTATAQLAELAEGPHTISASIADVAGNPGTTSSSFTTDRIAPQIVIVDPAAGQYTNGATIEVSGGVIDATATTVIVDGSPAAVNGAVFTAGAIAVGNGPAQEISVLATDAAGNTTTQTVTINIDRAAPVVAFGSPAEGAVLPGPIVAVSGTVSDAAIQFVEVNGQTMTVTGSTFSGEVPVNEGATVLVATAHDRAGNQGSAQRTVFVDSADPVITILEPAAATITNQSSILVRVSVSDASATTVTAGGVVLTPNAGVFEATLPLSSEGTNLLIVTAIDAAGNDTFADVQVVSDRSAPALAITSPAPGLVISQPSFVAQGTVTDLTGATVRVNGNEVSVTGSTWQTTLSGLPEGATTFSVTARDAAGNESSAARTVTIDLNEPILTITAPPEGLLTAADSVIVTGTLQDVSALAVTVNGVAASVDAAQPDNPVRGFTAVVPLVENDNPIVATSTDGAQRTGIAQVTVTRDSTAPAVSLTVGPKVTRARPAAASIVATDLTLDRVTVSVNGAIVRTFMAPPFVLDITAPESSRPGDVLTIVADAVDRAGNTGQATATLPVASDGAVVGQVLSDVSGLPITNPPATVTIDGDSAVTTDAQGRYSFATGEPRISLSATAPNMTAVDRAFDVASEAGTVALDARLTPIAPAAAVGATAATIAVAQGGAPASSTSLSLLVPDGAFAAGSSLTATSLSGQGLPGLLPLGWSPIAGLDLRGPVPALPLSLRAQNAGTQTLYLARYLNRTWYLASEALTPDGDGTVTVPIPSAEAIALAFVIPDTGDGAPAVPAIGDPLPGAEGQLVPLTATSTGVLNPPTLSPRGGTSIGTLAVTSDVPLPSGTVVQAVVTETFTLANGDTISNDARTQDFVLYRALGTPGTAGTPGTLAAVFPVVPSRSFATAELVSGIVHLDILAGRESVRGQAGGSGAVTLTTTTEATLAVAQGALTDDVPIVFQPAVLSSFLPSTVDVSPLLEFAVDFSGRDLMIGAEFSVPASQLTGLAAEDAVVIVRVDSIEGRSHLVPVAIGELSGDRYFARALHGLPGIKRGGRHVWYRVAGGAGFVRGITDAGGTGLSTIVEVSGLPFASMAANNGQYAAIARPGSVTVRARALGTSLVGEATADVTLNAEAALNISLVGEVTAAAIAPANGAIQISPAIQVEVTSPVSIAPASVTTASIQFMQTAPAPGAVPYRLVLSGSGRTLAIVPLARLTEGATYSVDVSGLADAVGGAITVPATSFTITSNASPQYDLDQLVFSFPDADGRVRLTGPPGTLAPGSTILVVNETTGEVSTLPVFNDGSVGDFLVAQISDRLIVTITDLQGRQTTFKRSEYVAEDGTTAVGAGGGEVIGDGGVEVRIPEDAVMNGVAAILKIAAITPDQLPAGPLPQFDSPSGTATATVATSLKIESTNTPSFQREVDLVFPKPADAPENAVYFVYRRLVGPEGRIAYETLDFADVEGEGANAKVVTASEPFSGYIDSIDGYSLAGFNHAGAVGNQLTNYAILMFYYDLAMPGRALGGAIHGTVRRVKWDPGATSPSYEPVEDAMVRAKDAAGDPLFSRINPGDPPVDFAKSQPKTGKYSLYDPRFTGGAVEIIATDPVTGVTATATAYEVDPQNTKSPGLRFARNVATANITFPAIAPPVPPSPVTIGVMALDESGVRKASNGIVVAGEQLVIGVNAPDMFVQRIDVKLGTTVTEYGTRVDPLAAQKDPKAFQVIADGSVTFATPGSYLITAFALNPAGGVAEGHVVVRAAAPGGGNNQSLPNDRPAVITQRTLPKADATNVAIGVLPQVVFTEPVQNIPSGVTLVEDGAGTVDVILSGVGPDGPIAELTAGSIVTSLTIQPTVGLKFGKQYTLSLSSAIVDTDDGTNNTPANKTLEPYTTSFTTFIPESISETTDTFTGGGMAVIGDRAYVASPQISGRWFTNLRLFDIGDPTTPIEIGSDAPNGSQILRAPPAWWLGMPVDVVAEEESELTGGKVVAVAVNPLAYPYHTANVRLYDVSDDEQWRWIGAVSLGREPIDGMIRRIELRGPTLYAVTAGIGKGIQLVDLVAVRRRFDESTEGGEQNPAYWRMLGELNSTAGYAQETIIQTIPINTGSGDNSQLWDLALTDITVDTITQTGIIATGRKPLVIATQGDGALWGHREGDGIVDAEGHGPLTSWGFGVGAGNIDGTPIAVVSAIGADGPASGTHVLAVVDLTDPRNPYALSVLPLTGSAYDVQDVVLRDKTVYIGMTSGTLVVNLADPAHPQFMGRIPGVSGRLAFNGESILVGTRRGLTETTHAEGGVRTAALEGPLLLIPRIPAQVTREVEPPPGLGGGELEQLGPNVEEFTDDVDVRVVAVGGAANAASLDFMQDGSRLLRQPIVFNGRYAQTRIPQGTRFTKGARLTVQALAEIELEMAISHERVVPAGVVEVLVDSNNDTKLGLEGSDAQAADRLAAKQGKAFAFWEGEPSTSGENQLVDYARFIVRRNVPLDAQTKVAVRIRGGEWEISRQVHLGEDGFTAAGVPATCKTGATITEADKLQFCWPAAGKHQSFIAGLRSAQGPQPMGDGVIKIPVTMLRDVENRFVFRCNPRDGGQRGCSAGALEVGHIANDGRFVAATSAKIDIRPIREWMSIKRARSAATVEELIGGSLHLFDVDGFAADTPARTAGTSQVTVLVHGFNVPEDDAKTNTFPQIMKRLYWAGHRVFQPQEAYTVGVAWPGGVIPGAFAFPTQEMHAFKTGALLAEYLDGLKTSAAHPRLRIVAHSLGTLVANTAVRYATALQQTDTLSMVEGALARETFFAEADTTFATDSAEEVLLNGGILGRHASAFGYPNDLLWIGQWNDESLGGLLQSGWRMALGQPEVSLLAEDWLFKFRWRRVEKASNSPWRGLFATNPSKIRIWNYFNPEDDALKLGFDDLWWQGQVHEKPWKFIGTLPFWATLAQLSSADINQWKADAFNRTDPLLANSPLSEVDVLRRNRRWAELSFYFRALSRPVGIGSIGVAGIAGNEDMGSIGGTSGPLWFESHGYMTAKPLSQVWKLYSHIVKTGSQ